MAIMVLGGAADLSVRAFGAIGDGHTDDGPAVRRAIAACANASSCTLSFPAGAAGATYLISTQLNMSNNTQWLVPSGSRLKFDADAKNHPIWRHPIDYSIQRLPLMAGLLVHNFSIVGGGILDGSGPNWWPSTPSGTGAHNHSGLYPPLMFNCNYCRRLRLFGVTFLNSPFWTIRPVRCDDVHMSNIRVDAPIDSPNTDGIDPDSCTNVLIEDSTVGCGDDQISVKASRDHHTGVKWASENVTVRRMLFLHGQGLTIGSAVSGDVRNVTFRDSTVVGALVGVRLKAVRSAGGTVSGVTYENIQFRAVGVVMSFNLNFRHEQPNASFPPPVIREVRLRNLTGWGVSSALLQCLPESPCEGLELDSVFPEGSSEVCQDFRCEHVNGTCGGCGREPALCPGLKRVGTGIAALRAPPS
jgi:polygalacturonase